MTNDVINNDSNAKINARSTILFFRVSVRQGKATEPGDLPFPRPDNPPTPPPHLTSVQFCLTSISARERGITIEGF